MDKTEKQDLKDARARADAMILEMKVEITEQELLKARFQTKQERLAVAKAQREENEHKFSDAANGVYRFTADVDWESVGPCMDQMNSWQREGREDVTLVLGTEGGEPDAGMALYDTLLQMRSDGVHVTTKVLGGTYSMGAVLLQAGTERLMGRGSFLMIHEGSLEFSSTYAGVKDLTQFMELFHKRAAEVLAERSILSKKEVKERWARRDWYMDYREAKRLGFVDGVG